MDADPDNPSEDLVVGIERRYVAALVLVALLATLSFVVMRTLIASQVEDAPIINVAGRQRMLSQRIMALTDAVALGDETAGQELDVAIREMRQAHAALLTGDPERGIPRLSPVGPLNTHYRSAGGLVETVPAFLADVEAGVQGDADRLAAARNTARHDLLAQLDQAVALHEAVSAERKTNLVQIQTGLWVGILLLLLLEAVFIFRPAIALLRDRAREEQATRRALTQFRRRSGLVLGAIEEALIPVDREGKVGEGLSSVTRARFPAIVPGMALRDGLVPESLADAQALQRMVDRLGAGAEFRTVAQIAPSRVKIEDTTYQLRVRPIQENDDVVGLLLILLDVTDQLKAEAEARRSELLQDSVDAANEANLAKSRFLAMMSHELRTPLNVIIGYGEMLTEEVEDGVPIDTTKDLDRITGSARHLLALINQVLDLAKVESGKLDIDVGPVGTQALVNSVTELATTLCKANNNRFRTQIQWTTLQLHTDEVRLKQILTNLLSNAAKFTENGSVTLQVWEEDDTIVFAVKDTGIGMTDAEQAKVWEEYVQADTSTTRKYGGTGLGLPLARLLAERLGGSLEMKSAAGKGTTMTLRTPILVSVDA